MEKIKSYCFSHQILYAETDRYNRLIMPAIFALYQEAALRHASLLGIGARYCVEEHRMWVLSRIDVQVIENLNHLDGIEIETWPKEILQPFAVRDFTIKKDGKICVRGTGCWLLLNSDTLRPVRLQTILDKMPLSPERQALKEPPHRLKKVENLTEAFIKTAQFSDIDHYKHVNNTRYPLWCINSMDSSILKKNTIKNFRINYLKATLEGADVKILKKEESGTFHFTGLLDSGETSFIAELILSPS